MYAILIQQGATFALEVTFENPDESPVDLSGFTARMMIRETYDATDPLLSLTDVSSASGILALGGAAGTIDISIDAAATAELPAGTYVYDLELVNGTNVYRILQGEAVVDPEATK